MLKLDKNNTLFMNIFLSIYSLNNNQMWLNNRRKQKAINYNRKKNFLSLLKDFISFLKSPKTHFTKCGRYAIFRNIY